MMQTHCKISSITLTEPRSVRISGRSNPVRCTALPTGRVRLAVPRQPLDDMSCLITNIGSLVRLSVHSVYAWLSVVYSRLVLQQQHPLNWPIDLEIISAGFNACLKHVDYENFHEFRPLLGILPKIQLYPNLDITRVSAGGCEAYWMSLKSARHIAEDPRIVLFYVHGGGFVAGDARMCARSFYHWMLVLSEQGIHSKVLCVEYPLAPEHRFPVAIVETAAAYSWLTQQFQPQHTTIIGVGDSAGANILVATMAALRDLQQQQQQKPITAAAPAGEADVSVATRSHQSPDLTTPNDVSTRGTVATNKPAAFTPRHVQGAAAEYVQISEAAVVGLFSKLNKRLEGLDGSSSSRFQRPGGLVLVSPAVDISHDACFYDEQWTSTHEEKYDYLPHKMIGSGMDHYAPHPSLLPMPYLSPMYLSDFHDLVDGPWLILSGTAELLSQDINRFAARVSSNLGSDVVHHHAELHMPHSWAILPTSSMWPRQRVIVDYMAQRVTAVPVPSHAVS